MIQTEHLVAYPKPEKLGGKALTYPKLGVNIKAAVEQYARGTLENRAIGYYMEKGMEVPDLHMMDKIEKLQMLQEWRKKVKETEGLLEGVAKAEEKRKSELELSNLINKKADEKIKQQSKQSGDTGK